MSVKQDLWQKVGRAREAHYFTHENSMQLAELRKQLAVVSSGRDAAKDTLNSMHKCYSPVTGADMFNLKVAGHHIMNSSEEGMVLMSYDTLAHLIAQLPAEQQKIWRALL